MASGEHLVSSYISDILDIQGKHLYNMSYRSRRTRTKEIIQTYSSWMLCRIMYFIHKCVGMSQSVLHLISKQQEEGEQAKHRKVLLSQTNNQMSNIQGLKQVGVGVSGYLPP